MLLNVTYCIIIFNCVNVTIGKNSIQIVQLRNLQLRLRRSAHFVAEYDVTASKADLQESQASASGK